ncbi:pyridoxal phosphate-dependent aminotransferase [Clostridium aminobutyricum]|uniref:Aminotransferase n=1 Tax=Clostridium aminobutyricum TaxID=33953 RepID=A0A939DAP9_CLOAM|nr:aminotransferase class I/II-fold pyridoxal phosphate-dependent enzyme [Clostridium aminobutyricum]MBN7774347.1 aminotransferase class I/II-fold pyridoxal phosphate-dependent enzyme [Clostridium aminobutyricum]
MKNLMNQQVLRIEKSGIRKFGEWASQTEGCMYLTLGEPDFDTPEVIKEAAKKGLDLDMTHYPPGAGIASLREKISDFEEAHCGLKYSPQEIIVTDGATEAIASILVAVMNPGDEVIVPIPAFGLYRALIEMHGGKCVTIDTAETNFQMTKEQLEAALSPKTKCLVLNSPNNPTGAAFSDETLDMIYQVVKDKDLFILCDDVYNRILYTENYSSFSKYQDIREKIIIAQSFSKPYSMTGWRVGYIMADMPVAEEIFKVHQYTVSGISHFSQLACIEALDYDISEMTATYLKRMEYVYGRLVAMGMDVNRPQGAFYIFPSIKKYGMDSLTFCQRLVLEQKVALTPGSCFDADDYVRISYCYSDEDLKKALDALEQFINSL